MLDASLGARYREHILAPGATVDGDAAPCGVVPPTELLEPKGLLNVLKTRVYKNTFFTKYKYTSQYFKETFFAVKYTVQKEYNIIQTNKLCL